MEIIGVRFRQMYPPQIPGLARDMPQVVRKAAVNQRFVFMDIVPERTWKQEMRFWRVQLFDTFRLAAAAARRRETAGWQFGAGKLQGVMAAARLKVKHE